MRYLLFFAAMVFCSICVLAIGSVIFLIGDGSPSQIVVYKSPKQVKPVATPSTQSLKPKAEQPKAKPIEALAQAEPAKAPVVEPAAIEPEAIEIPEVEPEAEFDDIPDDAPAADNGIAPPGSVHRWTFYPDNPGLPSFDVVDGIPQFDKSLPVRQRVAQKRAFDSYVKQRNRNELRGQQMLEASNAEAERIIQSRRGIYDNYPY